MNLLEQEIVVEQTKKSSKRTVGICLSMVAMMGVASFFGYSYMDTKNQLSSSLLRLEEKEKEALILEQNIDMLKNENADNSADLLALQETAKELTEKVSELDQVKQELSEQLEQFKASEPTSSAPDTAVMSRNLDESANGLTFTSVVSTSYYKASALSSQFDRIDSMIANATLSFTDVATDVTDNAARFTEIPNGFPVDGLITTYFNPSGDPSLSDGRVHQGIDISTYRQELPLMATAGGKVVSSEFSGGYGNVVILDHGNGYQTVYAHNSENLVSVGDIVKKGETVAISGSTGNSTGIHCHYEVRLNGVPQNPLDFN